MFGTISFAVPLILLVSRIAVKVVPSTAQSDLKNNGSAAAHFERWGVWPMSFRVVAVRLLVYVPQILQLHGIGLYRFCIDS